jgi:hypothetical protein
VHTILGRLYEIKQQLWKQHLHECAESQAPF